MNLNSISEKITIGEKVVLERELFINGEIGQSVELGFTCGQCGHQNAVKLIPYESGFPVFQLYHEQQVLSEEDLLKYKMAGKTSRDRIYLGKITVDDLPALYFGTECSACTSKYIGLFGFGEKQPGLEILKISGIWNYKTSV